MGPPRPLILGPEEWTVPVSGLLQVASKLPDQPIVVEQHRALASALAQHGEVLVVGGQVQILHVEPERLADAQPGLEDQAEQQPVPLALGRDGGQGSPQPGFEPPLGAWTGFAGPAPPGPWGFWTGGRGERPSAGSWPRRPAGGRGWPG